MEHPQGLILTLPPDRRSSRDCLITDCRGALIGATERKSDYYQAGKEWWRKAFNDGAGGMPGQVIRFLC